MQRLLFSDDFEAQIQAIDLLESIADTPQDVYNVLNSKPNTPLPDLLSRLSLNRSLEIIKLLSDLGKNYDLKDIYLFLDMPLPKGSNNLNIYEFLEKLRSLFIFLYDHGFAKHLRSIGNSIGIEIYNRNTHEDIDIDFRQVSDYQLIQFLQETDKLKIETVDRFLTSNGFPQSIGYLTNLTTLSLSDNRLSELSTKQLESLFKFILKIPNLTTLDLSMNKLTTLPDSIGLFTNLTRLDLGSNRLTTLPHTIGNLKKLELLELDFNRQEGNDKTSLKTLPLSLTKIPILTVHADHSFLISPVRNFLAENLGFRRDLSSLYHPEVFRNKGAWKKKYGRLPDAGWNNNPQKKRSRGRTKKNPIKAEYIPKLQQLLFSDDFEAQIQAINLLETIAEEPQDVYDVLGFVPQHLNDLVKKFNLNVSFQIAQLLDSLGDNNRIFNNTTVLVLSLRKLKSLPDWIGNLTNLENLELEWNELTTLPDWIGNLTNLTILSLRSNQLTTLPESFGNLTNLENLELEWNELTTLPESFGNLTNLEYLRLEWNQLTTLPESFGNLTNLQVLDFSNNKELMNKNHPFGKLPPSFVNLRNLKYIQFPLTHQSEVPEAISNFLEYSLGLEIDRGRLGYYEVIYRERPKNNPKKKVSRGRTKSNPIQPQHIPKLQQLIFSEKEEE